MQVRAETVSIDGGTLALILFVLLLIGVAWLASVVLGFKAARRAAGGDRRAAVMWAFFAVVECLPALSGSPFGLIGVVAFAAQVAYFASSRR